MINIKLDSEWNLQSDNKQYVLVQLGRNISYHTSLESGILAYFEVKIRGSDSKTIKELLDYHKAVLNSLKQALTPLKIKVEVLK